MWALITEEDVFCFKFVFLCFKQNSEQYRHFNLTYIDVRKIISSFKTVPTGDAAYLEFQIHISRDSNPQSTVHITRWQLLLSTPTRTQSAFCAFGEHRADNSCVACNWQTTGDGATWPSFHQHILQDTAANYMHFFSSFFSLVQLLAVFVFAHNNQHFGVVSCIIFAKCTVCSLPPLSSPNTEHTLLHVVAIFYSNDI